jgi:iron-sulfur cluster repair protein YtfE (RIC family)
MKIAMENYIMYKFPWKKLCNAKNCQGKLYNVIISMENYIMQKISMENYIMQKRAMENNIM